MIALCLVAGMILSHRIQSGGNKEVCFSEHCLLNNPVQVGPHTCRHSVLHPQNGEAVAGRDALMYSAPSRVHYCSFVFCRSTCPTFLL